MPRRLPDLRLGAALLLTLAVAGLGLVESTRWVGQPFPGFLLLENRVVAAAGLSRWPATRDGSIYQREVVAVNGRPVASAHELRGLVARVPAGTPLRYTLRGPEGLEQRTVPTQRFGWIDFALLFGFYLVGGAAMCGVALAVAFLRPGDPVARGAATGLWIIGMWGLSATDLYGPYRLFRLHAALECFLFAGTLHLALVFPYPRAIVATSSRTLAILYGSAALLALAAEATLFEPRAYVLVHRVAIALFGASMLALVVSQVRAYMHPPTVEARERVKVLVLGIVASSVPCVFVALGSALSGGRIPENLLGWAGIGLVLSMGYAVLLTDVFEVDAILRRTLGYALTSGAVAILFAGVFATLDLMLRSDAQAERGQLVIGLSALACVALLPLRDRLQTAVDRTFFRSAYDARRLIEQTSERLASVAQLGVIVCEIGAALHEALHPEWLVIEIFDARGAGRPLRRFGSPPPDHPLLALLPGAPDDAMIDAPDGALAVPMRAEGRLVARMLLGRRLSGRFYGGDDRRFLNTLAHQGAVAIENALALERLEELNRSLERKVDERTHELRTALDELRETQDHLVHQEKMASLGRLVAGIAHEINNPVNFIQGNLHLVREYAVALRQAIEAYEQALATAPSETREALAKMREELDLDFVIGDLEPTFEACGEGVERTTSIVRNLRTFSRSDGGVRSPVDLEAAMESTLTLLASRLRDLELVREYEALPPVRASDGAIKQVLLNLIANAADAVGERGRIVLRLQQPDPEHVAIEVEDDGCGIDPEHLERVFEPFFTTKEVGSGTGLGLSISYGVISEHGGSIEAMPGADGGARFRVVLPLEPPPQPPAGGVARDGRDA